MSRDQEDKNMNHHQSHLPILPPPMPMPAKMEFKTEKSKPTANGAPISPDLKPATNPQQLLSCIQTANPAVLRPFPHYSSLAMQGSKSGNETFSPWPQGNSILNVAPTGQPCLAPISVDTRHIRAQGPLSAPGALTGSIRSPPATAAPAPGLPKYATVISQPSPRVPAATAAFGLAFNQPLATAAPSGIPIPPAHTPYLTMPPFPSQFPFNYDWSLQPPPAHSPPPVDWSWYYKALFFPQQAGMWPPGAAAVAPSGSAEAGAPPPAAFAFPPPPDPEPVSPERMDEDKKSVKKAIQAPGPPVMNGSGKQHRINRESAPLEAKQNRIVKKEVVSPPALDYRISAAATSSPEDKKDISSLQLNSEEKQNESNDKATFASKNNTLEALVSAADAVEKVKLNGKSVSKVRGEDAANNDLKDAKHKRASDETQLAIKNGNNSSSSNGDHSLEVEKQRRDQERHQPSEKEAPLCSNNTFASWQDKFRKRYQDGQKLELTKLRRKSNDHSKASAVTEWWNSRKTKKVDNDDSASPPKEQQNGHEVKTEADPSGLDSSPLIENEATPVGASTGPAEPSSSSKSSSSKTEKPKPSRPYKKCEQWKVASGSSSVSTGTAKKVTSAPATDEIVDLQSVKEQPNDALEELGNGYQAFDKALQLRCSDLVEGMRVLIKQEGYFYSAKITVLSPPDVYGVIIEHERGRKPHIYCREDLLLQAVREVLITDFPEIKLSIGTRVCSHWSKSYKHLYAGIIGDPSLINAKLDPSKFVNMELDDGDSRDIPIDDVRLLPQQFPFTELLPENAKPSPLAKPFVKEEEQSVPKKEKEAAPVKRRSTSTDKSKPKQPKMSPASDQSPDWKWGSRSKKKSSRSKKFFAEASKESETFRIGDCAVFKTVDDVSETEPYIGQIDSMWENSRNQKRVCVKWFYHDSETKKNNGPGLAKQLMPGALFESNHYDENDMRTISHKCSVVPFDEYCKAKDINGKRPTAADKDHTLFYLAGFYDPIKRKISYHKKLP